MLELGSDISNMNFQVKKIAYSLLSFFYLVLFFDLIANSILPWYLFDDNLVLWIIQKSYYAWYLYVILTILIGASWLHIDSKINTLIIGLLIAGMVFFSRIAVGLFLASPTPWFPDPTKFHAELAAVFFGIGSLGLSIYFFMKSKNTKWNQGTENESAN